MSDEGHSDLRPVFRSANPYADEVDAEDAQRVAAPPLPQDWKPPAWSLVPQTPDSWGYAGGAGAGHAPWQPSPWHVPPPPPTRRRRVSLGVVTAVLLACGVVSVAAGAGVARLTSHSGPSAAALPSAVPGAASPGAVPASSSPATPSPTPPSRRLTTAEIAAAVDPAIVDVTSTLPDQGAIAAGTGMVITASGEVLTNNHVVAGASRIQVLIGGSGPTYGAHVIGVDPAHDVALIQIDRASDQLRTVSMGDSSSVAVGDPIVALGNALGRQGTPIPATGKVTALGQTVTASDQGGGNAETLTGLIQIDARIQPGDSGGPLVNTVGQVIGMDTAAAVGRRPASGSTAGFAIPSNAAMAEARRLEKGGGVPVATPAAATKRALLGVTTQDANTAGATVAGVQSGGPAEGAGIQAGDVIVGFGGKSIDSVSALGTAIRAHKPGDRVRVQWLDQSGRQHTATVTLASA